jgi:hypothetical protein
VMKHLSGNAGIIAAALFFLCLAGCMTITEPVTQKYMETVYVSENRSEPYTEVVPRAREFYSEQQVIPYRLWSNPELKFHGHQSLWYQGYDLSPAPAGATARLKILLHEQKYYEQIKIRAFDMTPRGQILAPPLIAAADPSDPPRVKWTWITMTGENPLWNDWLSLANIKLNFARFLWGMENLWPSAEGQGRVIEFDTRGAREVGIIISGTDQPQNARITVSLLISQPAYDNITVSGERQVPYQRETAVEKQRTIYRERSVPFWEAFLPR